MATPNAAVKPAIIGAVTPAVKPLPAVVRPFDKRSPNALPVLSANGNSFLSRSLPIVLEKSLTSLGAISTLIKPASIPAITHHP